LRIVVLVVAAVAVCIGGERLLSLWRRERPVPQWAGVPEDEDKRREEIVQAFRQQPLDAKDIAAEVQPLFDGLGAPLRAGNKVWNGRPEGAVALFQKAQAGEKDPAQRDYLLKEFVEAMAAADRAAEAYAAVPDARRAFRILALWLGRSYGEDELRRLIATHARKEPQDPLLPWFEGVALVRVERYELAEKAFQRGRGQLPDADVLAQIRLSRVLARYHTGGTLSAYEEIEPRRETFNQLAGLCWQHKNHAQLRALLAAPGTNRTTRNSPAGSAG
jgi:hypothetical protein